MSNYPRILAVALMTITSLNLLIPASSHAEYRPSETPAGQEPSRAVYREELPPIKANSQNTPSTAGVTPREASPALTSQSLPSSSSSFPGPKVTETGTVKVDVTRTYQPTLAPGLQCTDYAGKSQQELADAKEKLEREMSEKMPGSKFWRTVDDIPVVGWLVGLFSKAFGNPDERARNQSDYLNYKAAFNCIDNQLASYQTFSVGLGERIVPVGAINSSLTVPSQKPLPADFNSPSSLPQQSPSTPTGGSFAPMASVKSYLDPKSA